MEGTPALDEYAGCSLQDVALAVGYTDPESPDHSRAVEALRQRLGGEASPVTAYNALASIGHNNPPLTELLHEDLAPFRARRDALVKAADGATITDDEGAAKVIDLAQMCRAFEAEIDGRRKELIEPHRAATKAINDSHNALRLEVQIVRQGMNGVDGLRRILTEWDERKKAQALAAATELVRQHEEAEQAAAQARQAAEQRQGARGAATAQIAALHAEEAAETARTAAQAFRSEPTRGHLGQVSTKREIKYVIIDWMAFAAWLDANLALRTKLHEMLEEICGGHLRSLGVDAVAAGIDIPGVAASVQQGAAIIRR